MSTGRSPILEAIANSTDCSRWDFATSVEEVMTHLHAYVMARQVLYLGVSDTPAWVVVKANACMCILNVLTIPSLGPR